MCLATSRFKLLTFQPKFDEPFVLPRILPTTKLKFETGRLDNIFIRKGKRRETEEKGPLKHGNKMDAGDNKHDDVVTSTATETLELLESRLRRIEYLLSGKTNWAGEPERVSSPASTNDASVTARLAELERDLRRLSSKVPAVQDVLTLCMLNRMPTGK